MRLLLFAGFLGSGKTTLILAVARRAAAAGRRISVIVNEVGEVGIDGEVLRMGDLEVKEITAGCICCQIGPDLVRTLRELETSFRPSLVIVEASGIAAPPGVLDALKYYPAEKLDGIETVTVVDAARFTELYEVITPLLDSQIVAADRIAVTKVDEATAEEIGRTAEVIRLLAPAVPVYTVDATDERESERSSWPICCPGRRGRDRRSAWWRTDCVGPCGGGSGGGGLAAAPPSAAGHLEPYGARVRLRPGREPLAAAPFLKDLLDGIAAACVAAGATLIGHLKCVLHTEAGVVPCNLTSLRTGAVCRGAASTCMCGRARMPN